MIGPGPDDLPRHRYRQVVLAEMQHVSAAGIGHVGAVVDGQQGTMRGARRPEHLQVPQAPG